MELLSSRYTQANIDGGWEINNDYTSSTYFYRTGKFNRQVIYLLFWKYNKVSCNLKKKKKKYNVFEHLWELLVQFYVKHLC